MFSKGRNQSNNQHIRGMDPNYTHPLFCTKLYALPCYWMIDWMIDVHCLQFFSPFFWKTILLAEFNFFFVLRISIMHMDRLDRGWVWLDSCREVKIWKARIVWCKKGVRLVWVHPTRTVNHLTSKNLPLQVENTLNTEKDLPMDRTRSKRARPAAKCNML